MAETSASVTNADCIGAPVVREPNAQLTLPDEQPLEGRHEVGLVLAGMQQQLPVVACLATNDLGEPDGRLVRRSFALARLENSEQPPHLVEDLGRDGLRGQPGSAPA
jgi:hypothetical protein